MSKSKHARMISKLGGQMAESAGGNRGDDRYVGFTPSDVAFGHIELDRVIEDPDQPRKSFDEDALNGLAENIKAHGVQQPVQLRWSPAHNKWLIVYGHRRVRASRIAGLATIPCTFIDDAIDESTIRVRQLVENCQREDLAPMEMAKAIDSLCSITGWSNRRVGEELGYKHQTIGRYLDLLKLPHDLQQQVDQGKIAPTVAVEVLRIKDAAKQQRLGEHIASEKLNREQVKRLVDAETQVATRNTAATERQRDKQLLTQNADIAVYRNPSVSDAKIQKALFAAAAILDSEKAEN